MATKAEQAKKAALRLPLLLTPLPLHVSPVAPPPLKPLRSSAKCFVATPSGVRHLKKTWRCLSGVQRLEDWCNVFLCVLEVLQKRKSDPPIKNNGR